ncbi:MULTISPECIES: helix-turn-helix transcriptional regulator [unclassified Streptomyces]|uniref:helix-turn-helix domain-containing protein n=1 Tax=unclassified Streptomyces TaxID=2593676 RepID=UPI0033B52E64
MTTSMKPLSEDLPEGKKELAEALRKALEGSGKTLRQVALEVGISPAALSLILSGKRKPRGDTLNRIIRATTAREERLADPRHSYITERWKHLFVMAGVWLFAVVSGVSALWGVHHLLGGSEAGQDCRTHCGRPPLHTPAPSPGPWPQGLPRKTGYMEVFGNPAGPQGPHFYFSARDRARHFTAYPGAAVSVACSVRPDRSDDFKYLVRLGYRSAATTRVDLTGHWFWVDKATVTRERGGNEALVVPECDRQRRIAEGMSMTPEEVAYLAGVSRVD